MIDPTAGETSVLCSVGEHIFGSHRSRLLEITTVANPLFDMIRETLGAQDFGKLATRTGVDARQAEERFGGEVSSVHQGLEQKAETPEGARDLWAKLQRHAQQTQAPREAQVVELDAETTDNILKDILGVDPSQFQGRFGKVVKLDPEATKKVFGAVLPSILASLRGQADAAPQKSEEALPDILKNARKDLDQRQPKSGGIFGGLLDRDHDGDVDLSDLAGFFGSGR